MGQTVTWLRFTTDTTLGRWGSPCPPPKALLSEDDTLAITICPLLVMNDTSVWPLAPPVPRASLLSMCLSPFCYSSSPNALRQGLAYMYWKLKLLPFSPWDCVFDVSKYILADCSPPMYPHLWHKIVFIDYQLNKYSPSSDYLKNIVDQCSHTHSSLISTDCVFIILYHTRRLAVTKMLEGSSYPLKELTVSGKNRTALGSQNEKFREKSHCRHTRV